MSISASIYPPINSSADLNVQLNLAFFFFLLLLHEPKQLSPTLHKLAAAHAPLTHNCQSTDAAGSEEEGGEGERSNEGGGGGGRRKTNSERRMVENTGVKWEKEQK